MGHSLSRRVFIASCGGAALAAAMPAAMASAGHSETAARAMQDLTLEVFEPLVGQAFTVTPDNGAAAMRVVLQSAVACPEALTRDQLGKRKTVGFSLNFAVTASDDLPSGVHTLHHPAIGSHGLLMTPIGSRDEGHKRLEVVFNRMLTA